MSQNVHTLADLPEQIRERLVAGEVEPATGDPDLSARESATRRQVERLRQLARHPSVGEKRKAVSAIVEQAVEGGLSEAGAYVLIGRLGDAIAQEQHPSLRPPAAREEV